MDRALPRPLDLRWLLVVPLTLFVLLNIASLVNLLPQVVLYGGRAGDWLNWGRVDLGDPYAWDWVRWSPPAVWLNATVQPWGWPVVFVLNVLAILTLPWRVALVTVLFWPFWGSQLHGSLMPMIFVSAWHALEGKTWGLVAFTVFAALIPRPLMLPVLAVSLWRFPLARWSFAAATLFVVAYSLAVGQLDDWLLRLLEVPAEQPYNISPSVLIGWWWVPIGLTIGAVLTWKGWYGLASLAVQPYMFTSYLLMGLLELRRLRPSQVLERDDAMQSAAVARHPNAEVGRGHRERLAGDAEGAPRHSIG